jgi:hypothetical protein
VVKRPLPALASSNGISGKTAGVCHDHRMSRKLHAMAGGAVYAARKGIVERVMGQIKSTGE